VATEESEVCTYSHSFESSVPLMDVIVGEHAGFIRILLFE
jgi:hypothetical protein